MYEIDFIGKIKTKRNTHLKKAWEAESDHVHINDGHKECPIFSLVLDNLMYPFEFIWNILVEQK